MFEREKFTKLPKMRDFSSCAIGGMLDMDGELFTGETIAEMMSVMEERENGLGAGYAAYGLFPDLKEYYCLQVILDDFQAKEDVGSFLDQYTDIVQEEKVKVDEDVFKEYPLVWRFFVDPLGEDADDVMKNIMMYVNCSIKGAFCLSGGKDMAVFKGNGWATEIAEFYKIDEIEAYMWSAHSRFPTNTPGWWGGAHPFSLLGHAVVHNGEITSYGTNASYLKEMGYECRLLTDTEVLAYIFDHITRKGNYPPEIAHKVAAMALAPPYWRDIDEMDPGPKRWAKALRQTYRKAMANGPFSIIITTDTPEPTMIGHSDRKKLRPLIAALSEDEKTFYLSSELNAIHHVDSTKKYWQPDPGKPVIASPGKEIEEGFAEPLMGLQLA